MSKETWEEDARGAIIRHTRFFLDTEPTPDFVNVLLGDMKTLHSHGVQEAVLEERRRIEEALTVDLSTSVMLDGWQRYWTEVEGGRFIEGCIECENSKRIKEALINKDK